MPEVDLSTLNGPELKRLLRAARARNDGPLADRVEWEIANRGAGGARPLLSPIAAHRTLPDVEDMDIPERPGFHTALPGADPEPEPEPEPGPAFADDEGLTLERFAERRDRTRRKPSGAGRGVALVGLGVILGALISAGGFWGLNALQAPETPPLMAMTLRPAAPPAPAPTAPVEQALAPVEPEPASDEPEAPVAEPEPAPQPEPVPVRAAKVEVPGPVRLDPCARASMPADRLVCGDLALEQLDIELRGALARARAADVDPVVLGAGQTAWRRARDEVADPRRLARLYDARIRELDAATAQARAGSPPN